MSTTVVSLDTPRKRQFDATDPIASAWVSANAGSGKTYVLVRRVIRLLLAGVDPAAILCLTFTRAAAAEMSSRVFDILGQWASFSDTDLTAAIADLGERAPPPERLAAARRLFARALDTPGGLKIQTIHAFCERLLHQFAFEANVPGSFRVMEEVESRVVGEEALRSAWASAADDPQGDLGRALETALAYASDAAHRDTVAELMDRRDLVRRWMEPYRETGLDGALAALARRLGLDPQETPDDVRREIADRFDDDACARLIELAETLGSATDLKSAASVRLRLSSEDLAGRCGAWLDVFFTATEGKPRKSLFTKALREADTHLANLFEAEQHRLGGLRQRLLAAECLESTSAMLRLGVAAIDAYESMKLAAALLDFEDLVVKTVALLGQSDAAAWVHYKLDRGLTHVLVDEAQDTSPRQWEVVRALAGEFFVGEGVADVPRTLFAVGDEKQSIYSFQGAVPAWFGGMRTEMRHKARDAGLRWHDVPLHISYRSTSAVLDAVDKVFALPDVHEGVTFGDGATVHEAHRRNEPGRVVVWPLFVQPQVDNPEDWALPVDHLGEASPERRLAARIAGTVAAWLRDGERLEATGKPIRPGDVLVLTRTRGALADAINRALRRERVPVAGVDRLALTEHIAVMDLAALGRMVLLPHDDLNLAAVLKSPLIDLNEDQLGELARQRKGTLMRALEERAESDMLLADARTRIAGWRKAGDGAGPFDFYARVLTADGGRRSFLERLGAEADDVLDAFLSLAADYERNHVPSLQGFLAWLGDAAIQVKRDADTERDEVRVMTVHGAKGLEAPVVFLVDNGTRPHHAGHDPHLIILGDPDAEVPEALVWKRTPRNTLPDTVVDALEASRERGRQEYRRLLYVGMTRARDRLYMCGIAKTNGLPQGAWHHLVREALEPDAERVPNGWDGEDLVWAPAAPGAAPAEHETPPAAHRVEVPDWLTRKAPPPPPAPVRMSPSTAAAPEPPARGDSAPAAVSPLERGNVVHRLLQSLPDHPPDTWHATSTAYVEHTAAHWPADERAAAVEEVVAVLADPAFAAAFGPGSRAEIDIAARDGGAFVSGRIDRLAVTQTEVLIVDYKTNREVPATAEAIPQAYVVQLAHYRRMLKRIYPGRTVRTALLWTRGPKLMDVPEDVMERVLPAPTGGNPPPEA